MQENCERNNVFFANILTTSSITFIENKRRIKVILFRTFAAMFYDRINITSFIYDVALKFNERLYFVLKYGNRLNIIKIVCDVAL